MLTMLSTMAPKKAHQNPEMKKPGTRDEASCNMRALMTSRNIPKVSKVNGKVRILRIKPEGGIDETDDNGGDERRTKSAHLNSGKNIGDDQ